MSLTFLDRDHRSLYAAFDLFPAAKGAATHIHRWAETLFDVTGGGLLFCLGDDRLPVYQREGSIEILRFARPVPDFLERTARFQDRLARVLATQRNLELAHFRDPWAGAPIVDREDRTYRTVYEINGLPSLELPERYPLLGPRTLEKIRRLEVHCWERADRILTPSRTIRENLVRLGAPGDRIRVIPNGADVLPGAGAVRDQGLERPDGAPAAYTIYVGALQRWQGVAVLLKAFARLGDVPDLHLVILASNRPRSTRIHRKLAGKLGIAGRVHFHHQRPHAEVARWLAHALFSVAPLTECVRNVDQGCCPLKILESAAVGTPVIASDLPAVREILQDGVHGLLVIPDRPAHLARAMRILLEDRARLQTMGDRARDLIRERWTWDHSTGALRATYRELLAGSPAAGPAAIPGTHPHPTVEETRP